MKNFFREFVDRDYSSKSVENFEVLTSPSILNECNPNKTMIVVFSQFYEEIKKDPILSSYDNIITVWDIYGNPDYYISLLLEIQRNLLLKENTKYNTQELNGTLVEELNKFTEKSIPIGDLMKTEINHFCSFLSNSNNSKLYEVLLPEKIKLALIGNGDILVSSLMYKRYDQIQLMDEVAKELGSEKVTRLMFYDDYVSTGSPGNEKRIIEFNIENYYRNNRLWNEIILSVFKRFGYQFSDGIILWLANHIEYAISLIYLYEDLLENVSVRKSVFILDYFRDEYILSMLLNSRNIITYSMQHGFYTVNKNIGDIGSWNEIYYLHSPSKYRLVWGEKWRNALHSWGVDNQKIKVVGNLKYKKISRFNYELCRENNLLIILNLDEKTNELLMESARVLKRNTRVENIYIKPHPETKGNLKEINEFTLIEEGFVSDITKDFNIVISAKSTTYFEELMRSKIAFMYDSDKSLSDNSFSVFSSIQEFEEIIRCFQERKDYREKYTNAVNMELKESFAEINLTSLI